MRNIIHLEFNATALIKSRSWKEIYVALKRYSEYIYNGVIYEIRNYCIAVNNKNNIVCIENTSGSIGISKIPQDIRDLLSSIEMWI